MIPKLSGIFVLCVLLGTPALAQDTPANPAQDIPATQGAPSNRAQSATTTEETTPPEPPSVSKTEVSGGFTFHRYYEPASGSSLDLIGGYGDVEHNIIQRWLGAELQASGGYKNRGAPGNVGIFTLMAGPTLYPFGHRKVTFFGHILAGEGYYRNSIAPSSGFPAQVNTYTSLAWGVGAGLDLNISRHAAVRIAQFDYVQTKFLGGTVHESDTRVSVGIVYHFGGR